MIVVGSHAASTFGVIVGLGIGGLRGPGRRAAGRRARVARRSKGLGQLVNEDQLRVADANDVARLQQPIAADHLVADHRAVAAVEVAERPLPARHEDFDVVPAAALVLDDDLVGRRTADGHRLAGHQAGTRRSTSILRG